MTRTRDLPPPSYPSNVVERFSAPTMSAKYSFEDQKDGHFWLGKAVIVLPSGTSFESERIGRSPSRAMALALIEIGECMLRECEPIFPETP